MSNQSVQQKQAAAGAPSPKFVEGDSLLARMKEIYDSVARRAYELFESRGREIGRELEDWFRAESELLCKVEVNVSEETSGLKIRSEVPGFSEKEIEVSVEPRWVMISGRKEEKEAEPERGKQEFFCTVDLPAEVDPAKAKAILKSGVLEITLPKASVAEPIPVAVKAG